MDMDYKKLIKSRNLRIKILNTLAWIPDRIMVRVQYLIHTGRVINFKRPERYTEKLQLYKLEYRNPLMLRCTDKLEARKIVEEYGYKDILVPLLGVYNDSSQINFDDLPDRFVIKTTDGYGGNQVLICRDKKEIRPDFLRQKVKEWLEAPKSRHPGREWAYENKFPRKIMIEKLLTENNKSALTDYKFFCFNGKVKMLYTMYDRELGNRVKVGIYTPDYRKLDVVRNDELPAEKELRTPPNYDKMLAIAESLSKDFPHVRIDLYNIEGKIYFGEFTFYDGSGYMSYTPDSYDFTLGSYFDYPFK